MAERTFISPGIHCSNCTRTIERELGELPGVESVEADPASKQVTVRWEEPPCSWTAIRVLLDEIGFPPAG